MPRRRMIDPSLTDDLDVAQLSMPERWFLVGCVRNSDDEGRLQGHQGFIKSQIFPYDNDIDNATARGIRDAALKKMETWDPHNVWLLRSYQNGSRQYLYFPNWLQFNKPSHGVPSRLPPPQSLQSTASLPLEALQSAASESPSQSRSSQSSQGKVSLSKVSAIQEDFTKLLDNEKDLTDFLTTTLEKYAERGPMWKAEVIKSFWQQVAGKPLAEVDNHKLFELIIAVAGKSPSPALARTCVKAAKYTPGKHSPTAYFKTILEESLGKQEREKSP